MRGPWRVLAVLVVAVTCGAFAPTVGADSTLGAISGQVTDASTGQPLADVAVEVRNQAAGSEDAPEVCTAADGSYTVPDLPSGGYSVSFWTGASFCHSGALTYTDSATTATVTAPATTSGVDDAALAPSGAISGTVTGGSDGGPIADTEVSVEPISGDTGGFQCTNQAGRYAIGQLAAGNYIVDFSGQACYPGDQGDGGGGGFVAQDYPGASSQSQATEVSVSVGSTTSGIDGDLAQDPASADGLITGTLTNRVTGGPVAGVAVEADPTESGPNEQIGCTGSSGGYVLGGLPPGTYTVVFAPDSTVCAGATFIPQVYDGIAASFSLGGPQYDSSAGTPVAVSAGTTTSSVNGTLAPAGTISGTLTNASTGQPAPHTLVEVFDPSGNVVGSGCTQAGGAYTTSLLPSGTYRVGFASDPSYQLCLARSANYFPEYYSSQGSLATAAPITLNAPDDVTGIDGSLVQGATITGTVALAGSSTPNASGEEADVLDATGAVVATGPVYQDGVYTVGGLEPGRYVVRFVAPGYETQYYSATPVEAAATPVQLGAGATTSGINAVMVPLSQTGSISGTVTDATTLAPVAGIVVGVAAPGGPLEGTAVTGADGTYTVSGIPTGAYDVAFVDPAKRHLPEFSQDSATASRATPVQVTAGGQLSGVNAALARPTTKSTAALVSPSIIPVTRAGRLSVKLACPGVATCAGRIALSALQTTRVTGRAARRSTAPSVARSQRFSLRTGRVDALRFSLSRPEFARLVAAHQASAVLTVREGARIVRYRITVRRPKSHRR